MWQKIKEFLKEVRVELSKVTWPTREELRESTIVVVVTVAIISAFTAVVDRVVVQLITTIL
jgi:preprotein translocase subunit SecE